MGEFWTWITGMEWWQYLFIAVLIVANYFYGYRAGKKADRNAS